MHRKRVHIVLFLFCLLASLVFSATEPSAGPAGFRTADGKLVLAGLVDTSGYSSDVEQKYQGFLISEIELNIEGSELPPGQYGFGFSQQDKFTVMDVGNNDLLSIPSHVDANLHGAVPLKIVAGQGSYRLYAGKKWVRLQAQQPQQLTCQLVVRDRPHGASGSSGPSQSGLAARPRPENLLVAQNTRKCDVATKRRFL